MASRGVWLLAASVLKRASFCLAVCLAPRRVQLPPVGPETHRLVID